MNETRTHFISTVDWPANISHSQATACVQCIGEEKAVVMRLDYAPIKSFFSPMRLFPVNSNFLISEKKHVEYAFIHLVCQSVIVLKVRLFRFGFNSSFLTFIPSFNFHSFPKWWKVALLRRVFLVVVVVVVVCLFVFVVVVVVVAAAASTVVVAEDWQALSFLQSTNHFLTICCRR